MNLEENVQVEEFLNIILTRYFSNEFIMEENQETKKDIVSRLFEKFISKKDQVSQKIFDAVYIIEIITIQYIVESKLQKGIVN